MISRPLLNGFTLAELLIALSILGVIATFTIPKILASQQSSSFNALTKEDAATVAAAFQSLRNSSGYNPATFHLPDLVPYLNYVSIDSSSLVDNAETVVGVSTCGTNATCLKLHNGSILFWISSNDGFSGSPLFVRFFVDPDGVALNAGTTTGPSKSMTFDLYSTGQLRTIPTYTTTWFSW